MLKIGDLVYIKTDPEQRERMVTGITIRQNSIQYALSYGTTESWHYPIELSKDKNIIKALTDN